MLQPTEIKDTFGFRYYDHYGNRQSVTLRQGDQGGITKVNTDGTQTELEELKGVRTCDAPIPCENYNNLKPLGTSSSTVGWNTLFHESFDVMKDYYAGNITADDVSEYIRSLCSFGSLEKSQISDSLSTIYEHMSRANTRNAVNQNMQEAERFFSETGLRKDTGDYYGNHKGIIYYNSDHYFACESMQTVLRNTLDEMAQKYGVDKPNYERLNEGRTFIDGGITYNGVWNQETLQGNRYHTMDDIKYIACDFVPDKSFVYCEANIRMDAESNNNGLLSIIKEYADNKLLRTEDGKGHTLQIELERNSRNTTGHIEKRNALHRSLAELGIPVNNTPDRLWYSDYFGMIYV
jgi:hypothetical protein